MAVFTRYAKVMESDGSSMAVRTALGLINQTLDEVLAEQEGEFDGDTRWALAWFEQFGMNEGPFGDAETLSKAKNTAINGLVEAGIVTAHGGKVRLVRRDDLPGGLESGRGETAHRLGSHPAPDSSPRPAGRVGRRPAGRAAWRYRGDFPRPGLPAVFDLRAEEMGDEAWPTTASWSPGRN